jgi:hypothetical protein
MAYKIRLELEKIRKFSRSANFSVELRFTIFAESTAQNLYINA